jgi:hypothetical protein
VVWSWCCVFYFSVTSSIKHVKRTNILLGLPFCNLGLWYEKPFEVMIKIKFPNKGTGTCICCRTPNASTLILNRGYKFNTGPPLKIFVYIFGFHCTTFLAIQLYFLKIRMNTKLHQNRQFLFGRNNIVYSRQSK